jgi:MYXO-CTERM domain-containing protein
MHVNPSVVAGVTGVLLVTGSALADLNGVSIQTLDLGGPAGAVTYRLFAEFDDPTDYLLAVSGTSANPLSFSTDTVLINDGGAFSTTKSEDFAQAPISAVWDSWVSIGATGFAGNDTDYSPTFLDNDGLNAVITGSSWSDDDDGWFDANPGTPASGGSVVIAQFTVAEGGDISLEGNLNWASLSGGLQSSTFAVATPAPGGLALLGLAGIAGRRRRRA